MRRGNLSRKERTMYLQKPKPEWHPSNAKIKKIVVDIYGSREMALLTPVGRAMVAAAEKKS